MSTTDNSRRPDSSHFSITFCDRVQVLHALPLSAIMPSFCCPPEHARSINGLPTRQHWVLVMSSTSTYTHTHTCQGSQGKAAPCRGRLSDRMLLTAGSRKSECLARTAGCAWSAARDSLYSVRKQRGPSTRPATFCDPVIPHPIASRQCPPPGLEREEGPSAM